MDRHNRRTWCEDNNPLDNYVFDDVVEIFWTRDTTIFRDRHGDVIENIYALITPNELYMFMHDPAAYRVFPLRYHPRRLCIIEEDEFSPYDEDVLDRCPWCTADKPDIACKQRRCKFCLSHVKHNSVIRFVWNEYNNIFYDEYGWRVENIYKFLTPNEVYLFRYDHGNNVFPMRSNPHILCEIGVDDHVIFI